MSEVRVTQEARETAGHRASPRAARASRAITMRRPPSSVTPGTRDFYVDRTWWRGGPPTPMTAGRRPFASGPLESDVLSVADPFPRMIPAHSLDVIRLAPGAGAGVLKSA